MNQGRCRGIVGIRLKINDNKSKIFDHNLKNNNIALIQYKTTNL